MKTLFSLCLAVFLTISFADYADAKRFGSGGFGKAFKTSPSKKSSPFFGQKQSGQKQELNKSSAAPRPRSGMMGGLMGGLLAGGALAYLMGSGAFEGLQMTDMIIFALLAFVLFKLFTASRKKQRPELAGYGQPHTKMPHNDQPMASSESTGDSVPFDVPNDFDVKGFEDGALQHFRLVSDAWDSGDFSVIEEYLHPSLLEQLTQERKAENGTLSHEIIDLESQMVRSQRIDNGHSVSVLFKGLIKDNQTNQESGIFDVWHLHQDESGTWLIVGIEAE
jgi:predicted lipid-binding transport protein (Tim44 family)